MTMVYGRKIIRVVWKKN